MNPDSRPVNLRWKNRLLARDWEVGFSVAAGGAFA